MIKTPSPAASPVAEQANGRVARRRDGEAGDLNLLLAWPDEQRQSRWRLALAASVAFHVLVFFVILQVERLIPTSRQQEPPRVSITRLYIPPDLLTQRAPNRRPPSKTFDLGGLVAPRPDVKPLVAPAPGKVRRLEAPKQIKAPKEKAAPPPASVEAPKQTASAEPVPPPPGVPDSVVKAPPPPEPAPNPLPAPGTQAPPSDTKPRLAPPKNSLEAVLHQMARQSASSGLVVSDEAPAPNLPSRPGQTGTQARMKSSIELKSDPQGADFRPYLANILAIVRRNWFSVLPDSARMGVLRGRTTIQFVVNRDGSIPKLVIADPSGMQPLDRAAVAGLSMSNPLPPLPAEFKGGYVNLQFSFNYNMPSF
jgi:TonB family protein